LVKKEADLGFSLSQKRHVRRIIQNEYQETMRDANHTPIWLYYKPCEESVLNLALMRQIDEEYLFETFTGVPRMTEFLRRKGYTVNPKRIRRLYRKMGLQHLSQARTTTPVKDTKYTPIY